MALRGHLVPRKGWRQAVESLGPFCNPDMHCSSPSWLLFHLFTPKPALSVVMVTEAHAVLSCQSPGPVLRAGMRGLCAHVYKCV